MHAVCYHVSQDISELGLSSLTWIHLQAGLTSSAEKFRFSMHHPYWVKCHGHAVQHDEKIGAPVRSTEQDAREVDNSGVL